MKKLLAILLALAMVMCLAACGSEPADDDKKDKDNDKVVETTEEPTEEETTEPVTEEVYEEGVIVKGVVKGDVYKNGSLGLKFTKPDSWVYSSDIEIAEMMGVVNEDLADPEVFQEFLDTTGTFYDMVAKDLENNSSVMVLVEDLSVHNSVGITAEDYQDMLGEVFLATGIYELDGEYTDVELGSSEFLRAVYNCEAEGVTISQAYYVAMNGDYVVCVIVTPGYGDTVADIEEMFA